MNCALTSKGQVTIPKPMRDFLGLKAGVLVEFEYTADGRVVIKPAQSDAACAAEAAKRVASVRGSVRLGMSTNEYMALIRGYDQDAGDPGFAA